MSGDGKWTTGGLIAQWATAPPIEEAAIESLRRPDGSARVVETKIGWPFGRKCPGAAASQVEGSQQLGNANAPSHVVT
jgi:hypothetical protein